MSNTKAESKILTEVHELAHVHAHARTIDGVLSSRRCLCGVATLKDSIVHVQRNAYQCNMIDLSNNSRLAYVTTQIMRSICVSVCIFQY